MKGTVSVVVATYGGEAWDSLAERALASAKDQTYLPTEVIHSQGHTLQEARNYGAEQATGDWLVFLDADDELDSGYVEAMLAASGDIRQPSTLGIVDGVPDDAPVLIPAKPLLEANFLVIGSMMRRDMFLDVGGFDDYPILEDWALFLNLWVHGATIGTAPEAIYKVHVNPTGRNNQDPSMHGNYYIAIRQRFTLEAQANGRTWTYPS